MKRKTPGEQKRPVCGGNQTGAGFELKKLKCISWAKLGPEDLGSQQQLLWGRFKAAMQVDTHLHLGGGGAVLL